MTRGRALLLLAAATPAVAIALAEAPGPAPSECSSPAAGAPSRCLYRSVLPSAGILADCAHDEDCRVGHYHGGPGDTVWFTPPAGVVTLPKPHVVWRTATLAEVRFDCGRACAFSYFFEARRRRVSAPRWSVLAVDIRRSLFAAATPGGLVVSQIFSGREVSRIERPWAPAAWIGDTISSARFDPDGRLALTWLKGTERVPVTERISIPSVSR